MYIFIPYFIECRRSAIKYTIFVLFFKAEFKARGEWCKPGDEHPPSTYYHKDYLHCASAVSFGPNIPTFIIAMLLFVVR